MAAILVSRNGVDWITRYYPESIGAAAYEDVLYAQGKFVAALAHPEGGGVGSTVDGTNWCGCRYGPGLFDSYAQYFGIAYGNDTFVAVGGNAGDNGGTRTL